MTKKIYISAIILGAAFFLCGCEGGMSDMSNQELAAKNDECVRLNPTSPGKVTACENIRKECQRRRKDKNYAC
ncbi:MAG: hypothetical protein KTR17_00150 [Cellvibrionaceae bacterium]|nr:hypothetical protein [Cellvibrionaceae bacterium]